jgi:hypothetical protein
MLELGSGRLVELPCRVTRVRTWDSGVTALRSITASELGMVRNRDSSLEDESIGQNIEGRLPMVLGSLRYGWGDNRHLAKCRINIVRSNR